MKQLQSLVRIQPAEPSQVGEPSLTDQQASPDQLEAGVLSVGLQDALHENARQAVVIIARDQQATGGHTGAGGSQQHPVDLVVTVEVARGDNGGQLVASRKLMSQ